MPPPKGIITVGDKINQLTVTAKGTPSNAGHPRWDCKCVCGNPRTVRQSFLINQSVKSCGCLRKTRLTHGRYGTSEYSSWCGMKGRCLNPTDKSYKNYGGRGIKACERWMSFEHFYADMGKKPGPEYSIERKDNNGDYCPENCEWATPQTQGANRRTSVMVTFENITMSLPKWCRLLGVKHRRVAKRMWDGMSFIDAVTLPLHTGRKLRQT